MDKKVNAHDEMVLLKKKGVAARKKVIEEEILRSMDCDYYPNITQLAVAVADRYVQLTNDKISSSTLLRETSPYRTLLNRYYKTEKRIRGEYQNREAELEEDLLMAELELNKLRSDLADARKALSRCHEEMDLLRFEDINERSAEGVAPEYSECEISAYMAMLELVNASKDFGIQIDGYNITKMDFTGCSTVLIKTEKCPVFFKWFRENKLLGEG
ncbi:hypothetical protein [Vibrio cyclitrophicus]|uniref:hypothetical protein n=1 Tax=Vibrio cyclitrophicus TaxID=47951 RepID=UPI00031C90B5|nr:hypothetical protein [Vibrio cyclitrophicus]OEF24918.1 hypothetical protein OA9_16820 [Vibrio cyclitrophicus 1F97]